MKKKLILVCFLFAALLFTSCSKKEGSGSSNGRNESSSTVIKSYDGSQKMDLVGTWMCGDTTLIINSDGTFEYKKYFSYTGRTQLSVGSDGKTTDKKGSESKGSYKIIDGNILYRAYTWEWHNINFDGMPFVGKETYREIRPINENTFLMAGQSLFKRQ